MHRYLLSEFIVDYAGIHCHLTQNIMLGMTKEKCEDLTGKIHPYGGDIITCEADLIPQPGTGKKDLAGILFMAGMEMIVFIQVLAVVTSVGIEWETSTKLNIKKIVNNRSTTRYS